MNLLVWVLVSAIWGSTWLFIKIGLEDLPPFTFAGVRFVIAIVPLFILILIRRPVLFKNSGDVRLIALTGLLTFSLNYALVFWGEIHISSGLAAILYSTNPLFGLFIAHVYLTTERLTIRKVVGVLLGILGVALIFSNQIRIDDYNAFFGALAVVVASLATAYASVIVKRDGKDVDALVMTTGQMTVGFIPLLLVGMAVEGNPFSHNWTPKAWLAVCYLALVGSALAFGLLYWLIKRIEVTRVQLIPLGSTIIAVILGRIVLQEAVSLRSLVGGLIILIGLALTTWPSSRMTRKQRVL